MERRPNDEGQRGMILNFVEEEKGRKNKKLKFVFQRKLKKSGDWYNPVLRGGLRIRVAMKKWGEDETKAKITSFKKP